MMIEIQVASILHKKVPQSDKDLGGDMWDLPEETSVAGVLEMMKLANLPVILILNDSQGDKDTILKEDDVLKIFSAVSGG